MKYNFDEIIDRSNTYSFKRDCLPEGAPKDSLSFWVADMDFPCADPVIEALHQRIDRKIYGYTAYDNQDVYEAVSGWFMRQYGWKIEREELSFSPGVVPALAFLIRALTEPGDGIIIQRPVYYPFTIKIENAGRRVVNNPLIHDGNTYRMDYIDLEEKLKNPQNKGIIICSPHNPVGRVWTEDELRQLVDLCKKYKESAVVINTVASHHGDVEPESLVACIVQAADAISAARPGARRETLETYTNRLKQLEDITNEFKGVDKSFAIQAGREIRVMVIPEQVNDADMVLLARDISKQIEAELEYPGQIKVNVIRESRVTDYAK